MIAVIILSAIGTLFSFVLGFTAESCLICDILRSISLSVLMLSLAVFRMPRGRAQMFVRILIAVGAAVAAYAHLTAVGAVGCPLDCKKTELLGFDVRTLSFVYFAILIIASRQGEPSLRKAGPFVALAATALLVVPSFLGSTVREGSWDGSDEKFLFVNADCPECKELIRRHGDEILSKQISIHLLGDPDVQLQAYSGTTNIGKLLTEFVKSGKGDLYEYIRRNPSAELDVRRGREESLQSTRLAGELGVIEVPSLVVLREGKFKIYSGDSIAKNLVQQGSGLSFHSSHTGEPVEEGR